MDKKASCSEALKEDMAITSVSPVLSRQKRKVDSENSPRPFKRRIISRSSDSDDSFVDITRKSFYGSSKKKYLSPLERRDLNILKTEQSGSHSSEVNIESVIKSPKIQARLQNKAKTSPRNVKETQKSKTPSSAKKLSPLVSNNIKESINSPNKNPEQKDAQSSGKKFFRNSSPGKQARRIGMSVFITKGVSVKYKPGSAKKKATTPKKLMRKRNLSVPANAKITGFKHDIATTPKKQTTQRKSAGTPKRNKSNNECLTSNKQTPKRLVGTPAKDARNTPSKTGTPKRISTNTPKRNTPSRRVNTPKREADENWKERNTPSRVTRSLNTPIKSSSVCPLQTSSPVRITRSSNTPNKNSTLFNKTNHQLEEYELKNQSSNPFSQDLFSTDEEVDSGVGKASEECEIHLFESPAKRPPSRASVQESTSVTSSPDSVMLLSEIGSSSTQSTPGSTPKQSGKKLFSIFCKSSPAVRSSPRSSPKTPLNQYGVKKFGSGSKSKSPRNILRRIKEDDKEQMMLDFGQKKIGPTQCETCGMTYSRAEPADEALHIKFHQRLANALKYPGYKKENIVVENLDGSRIVMVVPEDRFITKKVEQIKNIVDEDLGFVVGTLSLPNTKTFLFVTEENQVVGFCMAQYISQAYRVIADESAKLSQQSLTSSRRPWCCSTDPEPARCGINRIWVHKTQRRKKIASKLLDALRLNFIMGCLLERKELAFSDPTPDGMNLASKYTGTLNFLVYKNI